MSTAFVTDLEGFAMSRFNFSGAEPFVAPRVLPIVRGPTLRRSGVPIVAGFMPVGLLVPDNYTIPYYNDRTKQGYQRPPQEARVNELAADLRKGRADLPTAILLNLRSRDAKQLLNEGGLDLSFLQTSRSGAAAIASHFFVVDGQHRVLALAKLIEDFPEEGWERFELPFICMLGADQFQEMEQFHTVNSKAKSVRTDLAQQLLRTRAEQDPEYRESLVERGQDWTARAVEIVDQLANQSPIWQGKIRFPAMEKGHTIMPQASMVTSLKPLLASPYFKILTKDQQVKILDAFWRGMRDLMIEAFDNPAEFSIQKGVGVIVLHTVLVQVLEVVRTQGLSVIEPDSYSKIMRKALESLQGDDANGRTVSGLDFWRAAPNGAAGSFSSSAGRRVLIVKIQQALPRVEVI